MCEARLRGFEQRLRVAGEQGFKIGRGKGEWQTLVEMGEVGVCVDTVGSVSLSDAVQLGACAGSALGIDEEPCPSSHRKRSDVVFDPVVVRGDIAALEEPSQLWPLPHRVRERLAEGALGRCTRKESVNPCLESRHHRRRARLTDSQRLLGSPDTADSLPRFALLLDLSLDVEDLAEELLHCHAGELLSGRRLGNLRRAVKIPATMGQTPTQDELVEGWVLGHVVVELEAIADELASVGAFGTDENPFDRLHVASRRVVVEHDVPPGRTRGSHDHVVIGGCGLLALEHVDWGLIAVQAGLGERRLMHQSNQRREPLATDGVDPQCHSARPEVYSEALKLLALAGQRQAIDELGGRDVRQERVACHALGQDVRRERRDHHPHSRHAPGVKLTPVADARELLKSTSLIITATPSSEPVSPDEPQLLHGKHFIGIGSFRPDMQELPDSVYRLAGELAIDAESARHEVGHVIAPIERGVLKPSDVFFIGELVSGRRSVNVHHTTAYKPAGMALYDLVAAVVAYEAAKRLSKGHEFEI